MSALRPELRLALFVLIAASIIVCVLGALADPTAFYRAWLCSYLFWLGVPLAGIALVLVHDLSGGEWMATARPALNAAIATTPLATLAGIPAFVGMNAIYDWTHPAAPLGNAFYLNPDGFLIRYGIYLVLWNLLAAFALWGPREASLPIAPQLSWLSGLGLIVLGFSASFAAIDWILSLEPTFWSSVFPYAQVASWFNTGMAMVLLTIALSHPTSQPWRGHMADLSRILLATTIFWAYVEFMQFLIIWEENLKGEIPWYLKRLNSAWVPSLYVSVAFGFVVPFFVLLWAPSKRHRGIVAGVCALILISRLAHSWLLVMPEFTRSPPFWLAAGAVVALGAAMLLLFDWALNTVRPPARAASPAWTSEHG